MLLKEHGISKIPRKKEKDYKFPGCTNHSYKELEWVHNDEGAYWCDKAWKDYKVETRPRGCILCLRPFKFVASNKKS